MAATREFELPKKQAVGFQWKSIKLQRVVGKTVALLALTLGCTLVLLPLAWMLSTSLKTNDTATLFPPQWVPRDIIKMEVNKRSYFLYTINVDGVSKDWILYKKRPGNQ